MPAPTLLVLPATVVSDTSGVGVYNSSDRGSDRGSGPWPTNAILRHCDKLFATWQGYDPNTKKYTVWVGTNQLGTSTWSTPVALADTMAVAGYEMDNHGYASIIADSAGYLHLLYGPHHAPMLEAISKNPWDASAFRPPVKIATVNPSTWNDRMTYSSIVRDSVGTLHLVYRGRSPANNWRMIYQRGMTSATGTTTWGQPIVLASTANGANYATGYSLYDGSIAVGRQRTLHVAYQMYYDASGVARSWGYLRSSDGGSTWKDWHDVDVTASLPIDTSPSHNAHLVQSSPAIDVRVCNIALDRQGNPWISVLYLAQPAGSTVTGYDTQLWHLKSGQWSSISLSPYIASFGPSWRIAGGTITFDAQGVLYVAAERVDVNDHSTPNPWQFGRSKEVIILMSTDMGQTFQVYPISQPDLTRPRWLASIERPTTNTPIPVPSVLYTDGPLNPDDANQTTDIVFAPLYKH
jgi:hypothetical protein